MLLVGFECTCSCFLIICLGYQATDRYCGYWEKYTGEAKSNRPKHISSISRSEQAHVYGKGYGAHFQEHFWNNKGNILVSLESGSLKYLEFILLL